jgi:DnaJ-class molecular chaperone
MDCPTCNGNGELEQAKGTEEQIHTCSIRECAAWPHDCPACGGSGYLEESC